MKLAAFAGLTSLYGIAVVGSVGCEAAGPTSAPSAQLSGNGVYAVRLEANGVSDLPPCNSATAGETAMVTSTDTLETCAYGNWMPVACIVGGSVAFDSETNSLWACTENPEGGAPAWAQIALPQGATGPQGPEGPAGAQGMQGDAGAVSLVVQTPAPANVCPYGGTEIQSGLDLNADGVLETGEITSISYVCNGAAGATGATGVAGSNGTNALVVQDPFAPGAG